MNSKTVFFELFGQDAFIRLNKKILCIFGPEFSIVLYNLIDKFEYFHNKKMDNDGWFFLTENQQTEQTGMSIKSVQKVKKQLSEIGFIETKRIGIPAKIHYKINVEKIMDFMEMNAENSKLEDGILYVKKFNNKIRQFRITCHPQWAQLVTTNWHNYIRKPKYKETKLKDNNSPDNDSLDVSKENKPAIKQNSLITVSMFKKFWEIYPRKESKGKATDAWYKLCQNKNGKRPTWGEVKRAIFSHKKTTQWISDKKKIPLPSTWLNQLRWLDTAEDIEQSWETVQEIKNKNKQDPSSKLSNGYYQPEKTYSDGERAYPEC